MVFVLPFEHATLTDYVQLLRNFGVAEKEITAEIDDAIKHSAGTTTEHIIVNAAVVVFRTRKGVFSHAQRKLRPAQLEEAEYLGRWRFGGSTTTRVFVGDTADKKRFSFATMICFDFIARDGRYDAGPLQAVLDRPPTYVFVPECNPAPLHSAYSKAATPLMTMGSQAPAFFFCNIAAGSEIAISDARFGFSRVVGPLGKIQPEHPLSAAVIPGISIDEESRSTDELKKSKAVIPDRLIHSLYLRPDMTLAVDWNLIGVAEEHRRLLEFLDGTAPVVWVTGAGGVGKTALVAKVLSALEKPQRVIWIDMGHVQLDPLAVLEQLLIALGATEALTQPVGVQLDAVRRLAGVESTTIVLDSFDRWTEHAEDTLPDWIEKVHGWNRRFVVTGRTVARGSENAPHVPIAPLSLAEATALIKAVAQCEVPDSYATRLATATGKLPLGCVWAGELYRTSPKQAQDLATQLPADTENLTALFDATLRGLSQIERDVVGVICSLRAPVLERDLPDILGEAAQHAGHALIARNLVMRYETTSDAPASLHYRHPFVRQFWLAANAADPYRIRLIEWAERFLSKFGGDRNWRGLFEVEQRWPNISALMRQLTKSDDIDDRRRFIRLWRRADTFMWSARHWRERLEFGQVALEFSRQVNDKSSEGHALYESLAQTKWHMHERREVVEKHLDDASAIFAKLGDLPELARCEWYRARMLRAYEAYEESLTAAEAALRVAESIPVGLERARNHCIGLAYHGIANALLSLKRRPEAGEAYSKALGLFESTGDREMVAVGARRVGCLLLEDGQIGEAIAHLETSIESLREMRIPLEEAETLNFHARALASLGERSEAEKEYRYAERVLATLGSDVRNKELEETRLLLGLDQ